MRKVDLRPMEQNKYEIIKKLVDTNGNKKRAALKIGCTVRTINRLIQLYKTEGKDGFIHGNRDRKPSITFPDVVKQRVKEIYRSDAYSLANFKHFQELVYRNEGIKVSRNTINTWLREEDIISPKAQRKTKKKLKKELKQKLKQVNTYKDAAIIDDKIYTLERHEAHPTRPRCAYMGELIQMDASPHRWFSFTDEMYHLHLAIDDATGTVVGAFFTKEETLYAYYQVLYQILNNYGIPYEFQTDRRTVFEYKRKNAPQDYEDAHTQFSYACSQLGISIQTSSVAQAKGRVERLNQTLQSRLPIELRLNKIKNVEEANKFLNSYIQEFNQQFALPINCTKSVFEKQPSKEVINQTLSVLTKRKVDNGHCIRFKNKVYQPKDRNGNTQLFKKGSSAIVIESFDGNLYVNILDQLFALEEVEQRLETSTQFDGDIQPKQRKYYIPPMSHPWKQPSFNAYLAKLKHREESRC